MRKARLAETTRSAPALAAISGASALVYESLWMRSFGLVFGNTSDTVAIVLAAFMGGLALGSLWAARRPAARPLQSYARVEMGIGLTALVTVPLLRALPAAYGALAARTAIGGPLEWTARALGAGLVVLPTTMLIGATIPLLVEALVRREGAFRSWFARLYLANTLGGMAGVLAATFVLVPLLGVTATLVLAAAGNLIVGGIAARWAGSWGTTADVPPAASHDEVSTAARPVALALLAAVSGACAFGLEVLWTRSYALVVGSSVYAFNSMLAAVLAGLVIGTAAYSRMRARLFAPDRALALLFVLLGVAIAASPFVIGVLPMVSLFSMKVLPVSFAAHATAAFVLCFATMLAVTALFGLTFPLLAHLARAEPAQRATGRLYAWNTLGAITGALATDVVLVRFLGLQRPYLVLAALALFAGVAVWPMRRRAVSWAAAGVVVVAAMLVAPRFRPWDPRIITSGVYLYGLEWKEDGRSAFGLGDRLAAERRVLFYEEGTEAVVAVMERTGSGQRFLSVNGKTDAGDGAEDVLTQKFIAHLPLLLNPEARRVLVIGWGAGATAASAALHPVASLECVEIEPATFRAASLFPSLSGALTHDPRFRIAFRDARNALLATRERYDVIVSEPSNPWISGVSNLFTREFYEIVRSRLGERGVVGQWLHYYNLAPADLKVAVKTFLDVFPHVSLWLVPPIPTEEGTRLSADLLLVGSTSPHPMDLGHLRRSFEGAVGDDLRRTNVILDAATLLATWAMDEKGLAAFTEDLAAFGGPTPSNTDDHPYIEFTAPRRNVMEREAVVSGTLALHEALGGAGPSLLPPLEGTLENGARAQWMADVGSRLVAAARPSRGIRLLQEAVRIEGTRAEWQVALAEALLAQGRDGPAEQALRRAVELDPSQAQAWDVLSTLYLDRRDFDRAEEAHRALLKRRPDFVAGHLRLAAVLARKKDWGGARDALKTARRHDPKVAIDPALERYIEIQASAR